MRIAYSAVSLRIRCPIKLNICYCYHFLFSPQALGMVPHSKGKYWYCDSHFRDGELRFSDLPATTPAPARVPGKHFLTKQDSVVKKRG